MADSSWPGTTASEQGAVETLIFLDIDGVLNVGLNVGIQETGKVTQSLFNEANFSIAKKLLKEKSDAAESLLSVMGMYTCDGDSSTYGDFLSRNDIDVCDIFVHRFVKIIRAAGEKVRIVISSSWRRPQYAENLKSLEKIIGGYLGKRFAFFDRTAIVDEHGGQVRLRLIGDYIAMHCSKEECPPKLNVLVLDDFFYLPINFDCGDGTTVNSVQSAESYLVARSPAETEARARIIHTYTRCVLPSGAEVPIGTGLSLQHLGGALAFLGAQDSGSISEDVDIVPSKSLEAVETWIFLDVDGVLNVGIADPGSDSLSFNEENFSCAWKLFRSAETEKHPGAEKLLAVMKMRTCDGNSSTYGDFLSRNDLDVCDIFIHRLVSIIREAGEKVRVILSSSWRRPKHKEKVLSLEKMISGYLGETFTFNDRLALADETGGHDRLQLIGDYVEQHGSREEEHKSSINVLVLDDLFYNSVVDFDCGGTMVNSLRSAESYLEARAPSTTEFRVKVIHTCTSGVLPSGQSVQVGTGLSLQHLSRALGFLGATDFRSETSRDALCRVPSIHFEAVETLIFLDIDGVLNVGIADPGAAPLSFNEENFSIARKLFKCGRKSVAADMLLAVMRMNTVDGNSTTYGDFLSRNDLDVCDIFIHRLVKIIRAAGEKAEVVIASSWRKSKYASKVKYLERIISGYLGTMFSFDGSTEPGDEVGGGDRMRLIGDYIEMHCCREEHTRKLNVLVLDDFFYQPISGWDCAGTKLNSQQDAESYLRARAPSSTDTRVRIIHTYMRSVLPSGLGVQVGTGLSLQHLGDALAFISTARSSSAHCFSGMEDVDEIPVMRHAEPVETLIFLDVDGVLNVGMAESGSASVSFNEESLSSARKLLNGSERSDVSEMLLAVMRMRTRDGNSSTYGDFLSRNDLDICDIFVHRLVKIIRAAGPKVKVIMSSAWRRPHYAAHLQNLEQIISGYIGRRFTFYDKIAVVDEHGAAVRLRLIGDYVAAHCSKEGRARIKVLVLDDFFYSPIKGFDCGGTLVDSLGSAESYIVARLPSTTTAQVRILHTYVSALLKSGSQVHVGTGLSLWHLGQAIEFLDARFTATTVSI